MADTKLTALGEYDAAVADADVLYFVDVSDSSDDAGGSSFKFKAQRFASSDGTAVAFTGGGTIVLAGFTLTAEATGDIADKATAQTFTNKTLTTPTIADLTNMTHDHADAAGGGTLDQIRPGNMSFLNTGGGGSLSDADTSYDNDHYANASIWLDGDKIPSYVTIKMYVYMNYSSSSGTVSVELYNVTDGSSVTGSGLTETNAAATLNTTGDLRANLASGLKQYALRLKGDGSATCRVASASLVID